MTEAPPGRAEVEKAKAEVEKAKAIAETDLRPERRTIVIAEPESPDPDMDDDNGRRQRYGIQFISATARHTRDGSQGEVFCATQEQCDADEAAKAKRWSW